MFGWLADSRAEMDVVDKTYRGEWNKAPGKRKGTINQDLVLYLISKEFLALKAADGLHFTHCLGHLSWLHDCSSVHGRLDFYEKAQ